MPQQHDGRDHNWIRPEPALRPVPPPRLLRLLRWRRRAVRRRRPAATLTATRGLPGAGKTTLARRWVAEDPTSRARINRDDLRAMCHDGLYLPQDDGSPGTEHIIITAQLAAIEALLRAGVHVICDDTNLAAAAMAGLRRCVDAAGASFSVVDLTGVPLDVCIDRDRNPDRDRPVGAAVIRGLHARHLAGRQPQDDAA